MGFFTSRKEDNHTSTGVGGKKEDKSMVQVLRSRFVSLVFKCLWDLSVRAAVDDNISYLFNDTLFIRIELLT